MIRLLVADDQELVREGFSMILDAQPDMEVVGRAADGLEALAMARATVPDVVLMDVRMPRLDGIEATRRLVAERPATRVLVLTTFDLDEYVLAALRAGASGFLLKDAPRRSLLASVRAVAEGEVLLDPGVTRRLVEDHLGRPSGDPAAIRVLERLTAREREVLGLIGLGLNNGEIAQSLTISEATVKTHVARLLDKVAARDRVRLVVFAYETGLVRA